MTDPEYTAWIKHHRSLFQLTTEDDARMFGSWRPLLLEFHQADLIAGSNWIAVNKPDEFRTKHLRMLLDFVRAKHAKLRAAELESQHADGAVECPLCRGDGLVLVPHPAYVRDGVWYPHGLSRVTAAVFCFCNRGTVRYQGVIQAHSQGRCKRPMTITAYEVRVPHWPQLLVEEENRLRDTRVAIEEADSADRRHGRVRPQNLKPQALAGHLSGQLPRA